MRCILLLLLLLLASLPPLAVTFNVISTFVVDVAASVVAAGFGVAVANVVAALSVAAAVAAAAAAAVSSSSSSNISFLTPLGGKLPIPPSSQPPPQIQQLVAALSSLAFAFVVAAAGLGFRFL